MLFFSKRACCFGIAVHSVSYVNINFCFDVFVFFQVLFCGIHTANHADRACEKISLRVCCVPPVCALSSDQEVFFIRVTDDDF